MTGFEHLLTKFDKIFILNMCTCPERKNGMINMLKNIGYNPMNEKHKDFVQFVYASPWPYNDIIARGFNMVYRKNVFNKVAEYDCLRNHCHIMQIALANNFNNILVLEDDICFIKEPMFIKCLQQLPQTYSMVQMDGFTALHSIMSKINEYREKNILYIKDDSDIHLWNMGMYAISKSGMETFLKHIFEKEPVIADVPAYEHKIFKNFYHMSIPMGIQTTDVPSNIRSDKEKIYLMSNNIYLGGLDIDNNYYKFNPITEDNKSQTITVSGTITGITETNKIKFTPDSAVANIPYEIEQLISEYMANRNLEKTQCTIQIKLSEK